MSFSPLSNLYQMITDTQESVSTVQTVESPAAYLTLTRSAVQAVTTVGTAIIWQVETRNQGYTWSTDTITIPSTGYYSISGSIALSVLTNCHIYMQYGTIRSYSTYQTPLSAGGAFGTSYSFTLYMIENTTFKIFVIPSVNCNVTIAGEQNASPSPFVHAIQISGVV